MPQIAAADDSRSSRVAHRSRSPPEFSEILERHLIADRGPWGIADQPGVRRDMFAEVAVLEGVSDQDSFEHAVLEMVESVPGDE